MADDPVILTTIAQVMQVFPEPALEEFEIENAKIEGYILHESDIVKGLVNYAYQSLPRNDIVIDLSLYLDAGGFSNFIWNPNAASTGNGASLLMNSGADFLFDATTRQVLLTPQFEVRALNSWNSLVDLSMQAQSVSQIPVPIQFTVVGGSFDGQIQQALPYDSGNFNDSAQEYFLRNFSLIDPFIQRLTALLVVLDIIKFWIKPLYMIDQEANIAGTVFKEKDLLPGWDHMQKRLENAIADMMAAIKKWGINPNGRVGDGQGINPEDPSLLRSALGTYTSSPTEFSPYQGWDDPFLFDRPDRTNALGDTMFGYTGRFYTDFDATWGD
jgi:hypothetical protein